MIINFDKLDEFVSSKENDVLVEKETILDSEGKIISTNLREYPAPNEINPLRYEFVMRMIDAVLESLNEADPTLGVDHAIDNAPLTIQTYYDILIEHEILTD